jgi:hypothetical protein
MSFDKLARLADQALRLKKAWLLAAAFIGADKKMTEKDLVIPTYLAWENKLLKHHIADLEYDFEFTAKQIFLNWKRTNLSTTTAWFAQWFDAWEQAGFALFDLGRVHEFEQTVGRLGFRKVMDCPPYAQILLQGFSGAAIRHPEYHLASDLALLYNLFLDFEALLDEARRQRKPRHLEHGQSLARSVILTCFNLLESFVSGLAAAYLLENPNAPEDLVKKLENNNLSLRKRFILFPSLITGRPGLLNDLEPPLQPLFGECKQRRDSFVHCEPGPTPTKRGGYVKEEHFHDVNLAVVQKTVDLTCEAICLVWNAVHGKDKPSWLPKRDDNGRFPRVRVALRPLEVEVPPNISAENECPQ